MCAGICVPQGNIHRPKRKKDKLEIEELKVVKVFQGKGEVRKKKQNGLIQVTVLKGN